MKIGLDSFISYGRIIPDHFVITGLDIPQGKYTSKEYIRFWTGCRYYSPWKDIAHLYNWHIAMPLYEQDKYNIRK